MFRRAGRWDPRYRAMAAVLASIGGYVNSAGFVLVGAFTSHMTGNVGRLASDVSRGQAGAACGTLALIAAFVGGAFAASMIVESAFWGSRARSYGIAVSIEAIVLASCGALFDATAPSSGGPIETALLCAAMGMQNSLVTRLSGAVVRTTHVTGVLTDLGIEAARWVRWLRFRGSEALHVRLALGANPPERPSPSKGALLLTIAASFCGGALLGSVAAIAAPRAALIPPIIGLALAATYAFARGPADEAEGALPPNARS
jgi:uncharacterized membrane protein YoaK (UPF0700 family)